MSSDFYSIQQLSDLTGLPRRTIHFYSQQGIIPPPSGSGPAATYSQEHLLRLQLVPLLRQRGLRLDEIRSQLNQIPVRELPEYYIQMSSAAPIARKPLPPSVQRVHYTLPAGLELVAPANLNPIHQALLEQLLQTAHELFKSK